MPRPAWTRRRPPRVDPRVAREGAYFADQLAEKRLRDAERRRWQAVLDDVHAAPEEHAEAWQALEGMDAFAPPRLSGSPRS